jgi:ElaB/YqjD/DUF883 family membrane-anchored ribosome-binding protein
MRNISVDTAHNRTEPDSVTMNTYETQQEEEATLWQQADEAVRENPIPAIFTAVAIGFGLGLLVRSFETERRSHPIRDSLDETSDFIGSLLGPLRKRTRSAAHSVRDSVRDAVEEAVDRARDIDVDPVAKWWRRLW